jgi:AraC family transcriptional regulator
MLAVGQVHLWQGGSLWIGRGHGRSDWHDHHALQIALALDGVCRFRGRDDGRWSEFKGAIVRSRRHHQFEAEGVTMAQQFIEPETVEGRLLRERYVDDNSPLPEAQRFAMVQLLADALRTDAETEEMILFSSVTQLPRRPTRGSVGVRRPVFARRCSARGRSTAGIWSTAAQCRE